MKSAKLYFNDTGLLCFLLGLSNDSLGNSSLTGAVWENYVLIEIATWLGLYHPEWTLWFYRDQQNREADFLIQGPFEQVRIIDAKWAEMPKAESFKKLQQVAESVLRARGVEKAEIAIAGRSETTRQLGEDRTLVSAFELANYLARQ